MYAQPETAGRARDPARVPVFCSEISLTSQALTNLKHFSESPPPRVAPHPLTQRVSLFIHKESLSAGLVTRVRVA